MGLFPPPTNPFNRNRAANSGPVVGSELAGREVTNALARFLPEEELCLFVPESVKKDVELEVQIAQGCAHDGRTTRLFGYPDLPKALSEMDVIAFHEITGPQLHRIAYIRSQFARKPFPITAVTYGISQQYLLWEFFVRLFFAPTLSCDSIICTSRATKEAFEKLLEQVWEGLKMSGGAILRPPFRLDVLPLGVDTDIYQPTDKREARARLGLPQDKVIILHFGRTDPATKTDPVPLLRAYREVAAKFPGQLRLVIAGVVAGDQVTAHIRKTSEAMGISGNLELRPFPSLAEGPYYYAAADLFVSLSDTLQESFGLAPVEAMASGLPVVVADWDGYRDTVVHGETGFLVPTCWADCEEEVSLYSPLTSWEDCHLRLAQSVALDHEELVSHLEILVANPELRHTMGVRARQHVLANLSWKRVVERHWGLWRELHDEANAAGFQRSACDCLERPRYYSVFRQYASEAAVGSDRLVLSPDGDQARRRKIKLEPYAAMNSFLSPRALLVILNYVGLTGYVGYKPSIDEICEKVYPRYVDTRKKATAHIMWLLKHGLLYRTREQ